MRELIQALLLQPTLAHSYRFPRPDDGTPEGAALSALVDACTEAPGAPTTAGLMQLFTDSPHEPVFASALATAEDQGITDELAAEGLRGGLARYWQQAQRQGLATASEGETPPSPEESERLRQMEYVRRSIASKPSEFR